MPVQNTDRTTTWFIDQADQTWTLAKNATITVNGQDGIYESVSGSEINVLGDITVEGLASGVRFQSPTSTVEIGKDSVIDAENGRFGIHAEGAGSDIINNGRILGGDAGIYGAIWSDIKNFGTISGDNAVLYDGEGSQIYNYGKIDATDNGVTLNAAGSLLMNAKNAEISGDAIGILAREMGDMSITNKGTIRSDSVAIESEGNDLSVRNTGNIFGDVVLGSGDDTFDTRKGSISGTVFGGDDNDTLITSSSSVKFEETATGGTADRVISSASYTLSDNIEQLVLTGKKDIDGTGNDGDNQITGNTGDNTLSGEGGADKISGGAGDDDLFGGDGADIFAFASGDDIDRIKDFEDGVDLLDIDGVNTFADFDALDIKQTKDDVVINLGGGDKLVIEDMLKSDITFDDIFV